MSKGSTTPGDRDLDAVTAAPPVQANDAIRDALAAFLELGGTLRDDMDQWYREGTRD